MSTSKPDRSVLLNALRSDLVRYLADASDRLTGYQGLAHVLDMDAASLDRALAYRLATDAVAGAGLKAIERLLPILPPSRTRVWTETRGYVRGQVSWTKTMQRRVTGHDPTVFVGSVPEKRYDTNTAKLVRLWLETYISVAQRTLMVKPESGAETELRDRLHRASRLIHHPKIAHVYGRIREQELASLERREQVRVLVDFLRMHRAIFERRDPAAAVTSLESLVLAPTATPSLFELFVGFRLIEAFETLGFVRQRPWGLLGGRSPLAVMTAGDMRITLVWQNAIATWSDGGPGRAQAIAAENQVRVGALRPDLLVVFDQGGHKTVRFGEIKYYDSTVRGVSDGLIDALGYLKDSESLYVGDTGHPRGFVVVAGADASPAAAEIAIGSENDLVSIARLLVDGVAVLK